MQKKYYFNAKLFTSSLSILLTAVIDAVVL